MTRLARTFAAVGLLLAIVGAVGAAVVRIFAPAPIIGGFGFNEATMIGYAIAGLAWAATGAVLVVRRPDNAVGWLMVVVGVGYAVSQLSVSLAFAFAAEGGTEGERRAQIAGWVTVFLQLVTILQFAIAFLFPTGRAQSPAWARFMRVVWVFAVVFVVVSLSQPGPLQLIPALRNPFGFGPDLRGDRPVAPILAAFTLIIFASLLLSMASRYRSGGRVERLQLRWFVLASGLSAIGLAIVTWDVIIMGRRESPIGLTVYVFAGALVPLAIGMAILRHRLYDIDRLISRTLGYGIVTAVLAGVFVISIVGLSAVFGSLADGNSLAVALSTLLVAVLFGPVRRSAQGAVDRRFDRSRYDAARTVGVLTARLRDDVTIERVAVDVVGTVDRTFHPSTASLWLRPKRSHHADSVTIPGRGADTVSPT